MYYIGLDVHKKTISYCIKQADGTLVREGMVAATRGALDVWLAGVPGPWSGALEATWFSAWIYDHLAGPAAALKVAHALRLRAIAQAKKKNDRIDAATLADCLRCGFFPESYLAPREIRELRRRLRYRNLLVRQLVQLKNKTAGLLMEDGVTYNQAKLHQPGYFHDFLASSEEVSDSLRPLLELNRSLLTTLSRTERARLGSLRRDPRLAARVKRLESIPAIGPVTALTWALEIGEIGRFSSIKKALSYCGLAVTSAVRPAWPSACRSPTTQPAFANDAH